MLISTDLWTKVSVNRLISRILPVKAEQVWFQALLIIQIMPIMCFLHALKLW